MLPKSVKVGGRSYQILYPHVFSDCDRVLYGLHDPGGQTIKISNIDEFGVVRHWQSITHTFLHEIIHAIDQIYLADALRKRDDGEFVVDQLAEGLLQVIRDNNLDFREGGDTGKKCKGGKGGKGKGR